LIGSERDRLLGGTPARPSQPQDSGKNLIESFLAGLDHSWQVHGGEILDWVWTKRPKIYFRTLIKLAQIQHVDPSQQNGFDRWRNREEVLQRLKQGAGTARSKASSSPPGESESTYRYDPRYTSAVAETGVSGGPSAESAHQKGC
jgi:hypothetical protein